MTSGNDADMEDLIQAWTRPNVVAHYATHRSRPRDLYPSEARFLPGLLKPGLEVLDVGCAVGGFCAILREMQPEVRYAGADISAVMVEEARRRYPESRFEVCTADRLPFADRSFDLVLCTGGTLPMILEWREALRECWRVTRSRVLFDVRLVAEGPDLEDLGRSYVKLAFAGEWDGRAVAPYIVMTMPTLYRTVTALKPAPAEIRGYGYFHAVSRMAVTPFKEVCMTMLCLGKGRPGTAPMVDWQVPVPWPGPR